MCLFPQRGFLFACDHRVGLRWLTESLCVEKGSQTPLGEERMTGPICTYGNPVLRKKSDSIRMVTDELRSLADRMLGIMYSEEGIGLAAEQIGRTEAVFVIDIPPRADQDEQGRLNNPGVEMPLVVFNPEIMGRSEEVDVMDEGCLSFPKLHTPVTRPIEVALRYIDPNGTSKLINAKGLLARAIQHEYDHLNGVLLVDHMSSVAKLKNSILLRKFKKDKQVAS